MAKQSKPNPTTETLPPRKSALPDLAQKPIVVEDNTITIAQLFRGNQDIQSWYNAVKQAEYLRTPFRYQLYNTYHDVSIDLHYQAMFEKRERAVLNVPFEISNLTDDNVMDNFHDQWMTHFKKMAIKSIFWGPTLAEFEFGSDGLIADVDHIPYQNVMPEYGVISVSGLSPAGGIPYTEGVYQNYILQFGHKRDLGLLAKIAPYILMKRMNLSDWSRYNEMFGHDLRVYYYDPSKPDAKAKTEASAKQYGSAAYIVLPKNFADVDFKGSNKQSSAAMYKELHDILNDEITIGIVGQLLTTGGKQGGSFSLGKVHADVEEGINMQDRLMVEYMFNYPFKKNILIPHGYPLKPESKGAFKLTEEVSIELKQKMWMDLLDRGFPIAEEDIQTEFGIPVPGTKPIFVKTEIGAAQDVDKEGQLKAQPLITTIGVGGTTSLVSLLDQYGQGLLSAKQTSNILQIVFGATKEQADKMMEGGIVKQPPPDPNADPNADPEDPNPEPPTPQPGGAGAKKQEQLSQKLSALYAHSCPSCGGTLTSHNRRGIITLSYNSDLSDIIDEIIQKVQSGELKPGNVDADLYDLIGSRLFEAVEKGYGTSIGSATGVAKDTLMALRENVYRFSAFKTYHFVLEANLLLKNEDGTLKDFSTFKKDILNLNKEYNLNNLRTEYNHARATSRMAAKWQQFKTNTDTLPLLEYVTAGDERVRAAHKVLDGIIKPVDDVFWKSPNSHLPPLAWNCRCTVKQLADGDISTVDTSSLPPPPTSFGYNWGEDKFVFPPDHPQFTVRPGDEAFSTHNFGLPLPS